jgi:hypothetical protein
MVLPQADRHRIVRVELDVYRNRLGWDSVLVSPEIFLDPLCHQLAGRGDRLRLPGQLSSASRQANRSDSSFPSIWIFNVSPSIIFLSTFKHKVFNCRSHHRRLFLRLVAQPLLDGNILNRGIDQVQQEIFLVGFGVRAFGRVPLELLGGGRSFSRSAACGCYARLTRRDHSLTCANPARRVPLRRHRHGGK